MPTVWRRVRGLAVAFGVLAFAPGLLRTNARAAQSDATTISSLIVSANPVPTPADEVASSVTLITAADIESTQERTLPDVLQDVPGVNVVQTGGEGGVASVFIRGTDSNHVKVLIDGIDISDPSAPTGAVDFSNLLTPGVDRVEVLRGPQSGLYGSDAIGGVVDILTKAGSGPPTFQVGMEGGSFATLSQAGAASGSVGDLSYRFEIDHAHVGATPVTPPGLLAPGETGNDDQYDNLTLATKLGLKVSGDTDIGVVARYIDANLRFTADDNFGDFPDPLQSDDRSEEFFARAFAHQSLFDGRFDQTLGLGYSLYRREAITPTFEADWDRGDRTKLDWVGVIELAKGEFLSLDAEHQTDAIDQSPVSASMTDNAGSIQLQSALAGVVFDTLSLRYDSNNRFGGVATWRVAPAIFFADTGTKLKGSIGTGFKAPTLNELYVSFPEFGFFANPALRPETSLGWDLGFEQALASGRVQTGVTWFDNDIKDLITANADFTTDINIGRATTWGFESFASWRAADTLTLRGDYTYTWAQDDITGLALLRRPNNKATITAAWRPTPKFQASASALFVGPWIDGSRDFSIPRLNATGYVTVNVAASYHLRHDLTLFARVTNLLDRKYQDPFGFQRPGVGAFAGVRTEF